MIEVNQKVIDAITAHAEKDYPHECGGMLIGTFSEDKKTVVETIAGTATVPKSTSDSGTEIRKNIGTNCPGWL